MISFNLPSFTFLQKFERQQDQGAPIRDIFNSLFFAKIVSEPVTVYLFIILWLTSKDPKTSFGTSGLRGWGRGGGVERGVNGRLFTYSLALFSNFFKPLRVSFNHSPLVHMSEATIFGLTEIQDHLFVCFHLVISKNSSFFSLTFLITLLD